MDPTARFKSLLADPKAHLDDLALAVAAHADPSMDPSDSLAKLDDLASGFSGSTASELCRYVSDLGFRGNRKHYYDRRNSYLNHVIQRQLGIPISLAVLCVELGRRVDVPLVGIGLPGHFLVRDAQDPDAFFDPFDAGRPLDLVACGALFTMMHGAHARFCEELVTPTPPLHIIGRILNNLTRICLDEQDHDTLVWVLRLRTLLPGCDSSVKRQLAGVLSTTGRFWEAAEVFEHLADLQPDRAGAHLDSALRLRANAN